MTASKLRMVIDNRPVPEAATEKDVVVGARFAYKDMIYVIDRIKKETVYMEATNGVIRRSTILSINELIGLGSGYILQRDGEV